MRNNITILLVEDDEIDIENICRAFKKNRISNPLQITHDGEEALNYLNNQPPFSNPIEYSKPGIILLDINMPRMNGLEFIEIVKKNPDTAHIPIIIMTTSKQENDRLRSFQLGVAGYIIKPVDFEKFVDAIRTIQVYWTLSELP